MYPCAGLDIHTAAKAIQKVTAKAGRGRQEEIAFGENSLRLIDESYNASPASVNAALEVLSMIKPKATGRRIAVLGDMLSLASSPNARILICWQKSAVPPIWFSPSAR